jgi:hypothetical protein
MLAPKNTKKKERLILPYLFTLAVELIVPTSSKF